jgi:hypothetical protein
VLGTDHVIFKVANVLAEEVIVWALPSVIDVAA